MKFLKKIFNKTETIEKTKNTVQKEKILTKNYENFLATPEDPPMENICVSADTYVFDKSGNMMKRADGYQLYDKDVSFLIHLDFEKAKKKKTLDNPKFHRTPQEEKLAFEFFEKYYDTFNKLSDTFLTLENQAQNAASIDEKIIFLTQSIDAFNVARQSCYEHSEGAKIFFQDYWEYCHNSHNNCFSWVDDKIEQVQFLKKEIELIEPWILKRAQTGFIQTSIYKEFPEEPKEVLRTIINRLSNEKKIKKYKKGNSYFIST